MLVNQFFNLVLLSIASVLTFSLYWLFHTNNKEGVGRSKAAVLLLIVAPIVGFCVCSMFCCTLLCVRSSFAIILMGKRERWSLYVVWPPGVLWLFITVPWVGLQCVIVVFSDHAHLLFSCSSILIKIRQKSGIGVICGGRGYHGIPIKSPWG